MAVAPRPSPSMARVAAERARIEQLLAEAYQALGRIAALSAVAEMTGIDDASPKTAPLPDVLCAKDIAERVGVSLREAYTLMDRQMVVTYVASRKGVAAADYVAWLSGLETSSAAPRRLVAR